MAESQVDRAVAYLRLHPRAKQGEVAAATNTTVRTVQRARAKLGVYSPITETRRVQQAHFEAVKAEALAALRADPFMQLSDLARQFGISRHYACKLRQLVPVHREKLTGTSLQFDERDVGPGYDTRHFAALRLPLNRMAEVFA